MKYGWNGPSQAQEEMHMSFDVQIIDGNASSGKASRDEIDSRRCSEIINTITGNVFKRNLDPSAKWILLYLHARKHHQEFECVYEKESFDVDTDGNIIWKKDELESMVFKDLKNIGLNFSVTGRSKDELIGRILKKQEANLAKSA